MARTAKAVVAGSAQYAAERKQFDKVREHIAAALDIMDSLPRGLTQQLNVFGGNTENLYDAVVICDEWLNDFAAFRDWALANGYADNLSIDRIDNDGNYEPSNCRWTDAKTQANNRGRNRCRGGINAVA